MLDLLTPPAVTITTTLTAGAPTATVASTGAIAGALRCSGSGIAPGTLVKSINSATQLTLTTNATASGSVPVTFGIEVITLAEAKLFLKVDDDLTADDTLIAGLITSARQKCEAESWRTFLTSTWAYGLDEFPRSVSWFYGGRGDQIRVPNPPLVSVQSLTYVDEEGIVQTLPTNQYLVKTGTPGIVSPAWATVWPFGRYQPGAVVLSYTAGYGLADAVPETIKSAAKLALSHFYFNRGDSGMELPPGIAALLSPVQSGAVS